VSNAAVDLIRGWGRETHAGFFLASSQQGWLRAWPQEVFDEARRLTPQQRLQLALDLSDAAAALHHACSPKR